MLNQYIYVDFREKKKCTQCYMNSHHRVLKNIFLFTAHGVAGKDRKVFWILRGRQKCDLNVERNKKCTVKVLARKTR